MDFLDSSVLEKSCCLESDGTGSYRKMYVNSKETQKKNAENLGCLGEDPERVVSAFL